MPYDVFFVFLYHNIHPQIKGRDNFQFLCVGPRPLGSDRSSAIHRRHATPRHASRTIIIIRLRIILSCHSLLFSVAAVKQQANRTPAPSQLKSQPANEASKQYLPAADGTGLTAAASTDRIAPCSQRHPIRYQDARSDFRRFGELTLVFLELQGLSKRAYVLY